MAENNTTTQGGQRDRGDQTPNLLVIHTDQQSSWSLSCYGGTLVDTPNIDRLAREGALFSQFFTNSAVCTPSRGCFVTGRYPHHHGAYINNIPLNRDEVTFAEALRRQGYDTGYAGKWHLDGTMRPGWVHTELSMGFEDCRFMFNRGHWKKVEEKWMGDVQPRVFPYNVIGDEKTFTTDWLADKTVEFIQKPRAKPFCYMVSIPDPHDPMTVRPPYDSMYRPEDMPLPNTLAQENLPDWVRMKQLAYAGVHRYAEGFEERLKVMKAGYCGEVKCIDDNVGKIMSCLEDMGILDETVVVFTTDHGEYMGEHGLMGKNMLYEPAYRIPLLMRWPKGIPAGTVVDKFFTTVDFQQTVLGLMGLEPSGREEGRDGSQLLAGSGADGRDTSGAAPVSWDDEAFIHHSSFDQAGIFTPDYELAFVKDHDPILFDRREDPEQADNLYGQKAAADVTRELTGRILDHHEKLSSPSVPWIRDLYRSL
jgi:arylsulfatase A-like enzyme